MLPAAPPEPLNIEELLTGVFPNRPRPLPLAFTSCHPPLCFSISSLPPSSFTLLILSCSFTRLSVCLSVLMLRVLTCASSVEPQTTKAFASKAWFVAFQKRQTGQMKWMAHTWRVPVVGPWKLVAITMCKERAPEREWQNYKAECGRMQDVSIQSRKITKICKCFHVMCKLAVILLGRKRVEVLSGYIWERLGMRRQSTCL